MRGARGFIFLFYLPPTRPQLTFLIVNKMQLATVMRDGAVPINVTRYKTKKYSATVRGTVLLPLWTRDALK